MDVTMSSDRDKRQSEDLASKTEPSNLDNEVVVVDDDGTTVNASGWKDQLDRQYGLLSLCGIALTVDNAWVALGSSISVSIGKTLLMSPCLDRRSFDTCFRQQTADLLDLYSAL